MFFALFDELRGARFLRLVRRGFAVALLATLYATSASAACDHGHADATQLSFDVRDKDTFIGLQMALNFGLSPESFPKDDIAKNARACPRGSFVARDVHYAMLGTEDALPERWAERGPQGEVAYLAELPKPAPALAWLKAHTADNSTSMQPKPGEMMVVLAVTDGGSRKIFAYFDTMPDDATAARALCGALSGQLSELGSYDAADAVTTFTGTAQTPISTVTGCGLVPAP
jgi:hypothetical protein